MNIQCLQCKGRHFCGRPYCPVQHKLTSQKQFNLTAKQDYFGEAPNVFVGKFGYPNVNVGVLNVESYQNHDDPLLWAHKGYSIDKILDLRSNLINSNFQTSVKSFNDKLLEMSQEIAMAYKPVDVEINLAKKPQFDLSFNQDTMPHGPTVKLKKAFLTSNPKIPHKVESAVNDIHLKANEAITDLYKRGVDEHYLTKLLSIGTLGMKKDRKLVPTRWSITAVDDNVCKQVLTKVKDYPETGYLAYFGSHLGNYYLILFFPDVFRYELFETYVGSAEYGWPFATDYEDYSGRKDYASATAGGYYAARLAVAEELSRIKRQGSCLCLRFITNEYWAPLGVWVVREAARNAMKSSPIEFGSKELMLEYAKKFVKKKFGYDADNLFNKSLLLKELKQQSKLTAFL